MEEMPRKIEAPADLQEKYRSIRNVTLTLDQLGVRIIPVKEQTLEAIERLVAFKVKEPSPQEAYLKRLLDDLLELLEDYLSRIKNLRAAVQLLS